MLNNFLSKTEKVEHCYNIHKSKLHSKPLKWNKKLKREQSEMNRQLISILIGWTIGELTKLNE